MYFIDRQKITDTLSYMETVYAHFKELGKPKGAIEYLALERMATVMIEAIIDVGNSMIDGFIMRDPGGYEDIIDILEDEKVVTAANAGSLKKVILLRKQLVQQFIAVNHEQIFAVLSENEGALLSFPNDIKRYLVEELGPVSAFLPNEKG